MLNIYTLDIESKMQNEIN